MRALVAFLIVALVLPQYAVAAHVHNSVYSLNTLKQVAIVGEINPGMTASVYVQMDTTAAVPGPRLVLIDSPGGYVDEGIKIIDMLEKEKAATHELLVCVVIGNAHSMAFNILTHCDVRLATPGSTMVVHKVALGGPPAKRMTAHNLRILSDELDKDDARWREENAQAMHLSLPEYDKYADLETRWQAGTLIKMGYLNGIVLVGP